jgi:hypothetical protein
VEALCAERFMEAKKDQFILKRARTRRYQASRPDTSRRLIAATENEGVREGQDHRGFPLQASRKPTR